MTVDWRAGATNSIICTRRDTSSGMSTYCKQQMATSSECEFSVRMGSVQSRHK
jgi:hypothetical protein